MSQPQIRYTIVGFEKTILVDYAASSGDFIDYTQETIFSKIEKEGAFLWTSNTCNYFYQKTHGLIVLTMFDKSYTKDMSLKFVQEVQDRFQQQYSVEQYSKASKFSALEFKEQLKQLTEDYNRNYQDKSREALDEVLKYKSVLVEHLEKILQRESEIIKIQDKINDMDDKQIHLMEMTN